MGGFQVTMASNWYYLEEADESKKKGPFELDEILDLVSSDCLISNDETPWIFLSEYLENDQSDKNKELFPLKAETKERKEKKKEIQIKIDSTNLQPIECIEEENEQQNDALNVLKQQLQREKEEKIKNEKLRKEHSEKVKAEVLSIESSKEFIEEWFVWIDSVKIGPLSRWELIKKAKNGHLNEQSLTFLNGQYRHLRDCGELRGLLPFAIDLNADAAINDEMQYRILLTRNAMENKQYFFKNAYQQSIGPLSLSEIFYKFSDGIIGRNTRIKTENEICWKSFDFLQNKFAKEWKKWKDGDESDDNEANECFDDKEIESFDPSFRALIDLDKNFKND